MSKAIRFQILRSIVGKVDRVANDSIVPLPFDYECLAEKVQASLDNLRKLDSLESEDIATSVERFRQSILTLADSILTDRERQVHLRLDLKKLREELKNSTS
jgi:hypothetical protein